METKLDELRFERFLGIYVYWFLFIIFIIFIQTDIVFSLAHNTGQFNSSENLYSQKLQPIFFIDIVCLLHE